MGAEFRSGISLTVWPTTEVDDSAASEEAGIAPSQTFTGEQVDLDVEVSFEQEKSSTEIVIWNAGLPAEVNSVFRKNHLIAVDLGRGGFGDQGAVQMFRAVIGRIDGVEVRGEDADIGYVISVVPLDYRLREVHVRHSFLAENGPHRLSNVLRTMLRIAGVSAFRVTVDTDLEVENFTCDGPLEAEMRRAARKAGAVLGVFLHGGSVIVSDSFLAGIVIAEDFILDASRKEQPSRKTPQPVDFELEAGEGVDLADALEPVTDADQLELGSAPASEGFEVVTILLPEVIKGMQVKIIGENALARMGIFGAKEKVFNVLGVVHTATSRSDGPVDTTTLTLGSALEEV